VSIFGIGVDIVKIDRVKASLLRHGDDFAKKILNENELKKFLALKNQAAFLAKRFAAKEAFAKALGTGIVEGVTFPMIEVVNNDNGKPEIVLHGETKKRVDAHAIHSIFLSLSDEKDYAVAQVVLET